MSNILKLVLTDHWFEEIKSGRKTHEYRKTTRFWHQRIGDLYCKLSAIKRKLLTIPKETKYLVQFQKACRKNPERITFEIRDIKLVDGKNTDLHIEGLVFDIELGERVQ